MVAKCFFTIINIDCEFEMLKVKLPHEELIVDDKEQQIK